MCCNQNLIPINFLSKNLLDSRRQCSALIRKLVCSRGHRALTSPCYAKHRLFLFHCLGKALFSIHTTLSKLIESKLRMNRLNFWLSIELVLSSFDLKRKRKIFFQSQFRRLHLNCPLLIRGQHLCLEIFLLQFSVPHKDFQHRALGIFAISSYSQLDLWLPGVSSFETLKNIFMICLFNLSTEPVGFKAPVFNSESKGSIFEKAIGSTLSLLCQAQAFPVPMIR